MAFIGRERELQVLNTAYSSDQAQLIPIYGRRRVGKSELILEFLRDKRGLYFLGKEAPSGLQLTEFMELAATALDEPLLAELAVETWSKALDLVSDRLPESEPFVMVFDEFQWTTAASPELPSVLQGFWDRRWKRKGNLVVILCGSYVGFMEREVLGPRSPLFGRRTAQILLRPFDYLDAALFHPDYSLEEKARTYFVCGGVPAYLEYFRPERSLESNIQDVVLDPYGPLFKEPDFLLREELRDVTNYNAVLLAIAAGAGSQKQISLQSGVPERSLPYYLKQLVELGYVKKRLPLISDGANGRKVRFELDDPLLRFWYRFVYPNQSALVRSGPREVFLGRIKPALQSYFGTCFERLVREALPNLHKAEGIQAPSRIGEYWSKNTQIDLVAIRDDGWIELGECKWSPVRSPAALAKELESRLPHYPNPTNATISKRLFTRKPIKTIPPACKSYHWHSLEDLYTLRPGIPR